MCGVAGAAISAVGAVMQGVSSYNAAKTQAGIVRQQAEYQAQVYEQNAAQARNDAEATAKQGRYEEGQLRDKRRQIMGAQNAAAGASGLSLASGSMNDVAASTVIQSESDLDMLRRNYQQQKFKYINEGVQLQGQANMARTAGDNQAAALKSQGKSALLGSLLTSAGTVASKWDSIFGAKSGGAAGSPAGSFGVSAYKGGSLPGWGWSAKSTDSDYFNSTWW